VLVAVPARARERDETPAAWVAPIYRPDIAVPRIVLPDARVETSYVRAVDPTLSRGARIAIIVSAIVVGVIILFGVVSIRH
jgi:hypothetical protein